MKRTALAVAFVICLLLSGCGLLDGGEHVWMELHAIPTAAAGQQDTSAADYTQLYGVLSRLVETGTMQANIFIGRYDQDRLPGDMQRAMEAIRREHPIGAYAVLGISYTPGIQGGERVLVVTIEYRRNETEIKKIQRVADNAAAAQAVQAALNSCENGIVLLSTEERMYVACGKLYACGLAGDGEDE